MTILFEDISPDTPNLTAFDGASTAGLTLQVVGHEGELYAVSLNAGVWRSLSGGPWGQLQGPPGAYPARAYCIAMDPQNFAHLAVGERDGDAINPTQDRAGVWESFDSGNTWTCILDPATDAPGGCSSQAIPAIAFSSQGLFVATACGLAIRRPGDSTFQWMSKNPLNSQPIILATALAVSENKVWARIESRNLQNPTQTDYTLLVWSPFSPIEVIPIPAHAIFDGARGDRFSLAALDSNAYISVLGEKDPQTGNNFNTLLIYDATHGLWLTQRVLDSLNGTGAGGRRFVKMFILGNQSLSLSLGNRLQLFFCGAQDVFRARGFLPSVPGGFSGLIDWESFAHTAAAGPNSDLHVHSDIWDFHMINDFDTPGPIHWIAGDGGVFELRPPLPWLTRNAGLHTHHVHTLTILPTNDFSHGLDHSRLAYATSDNDAWWRRDDRTWAHENSLGDASWTAGDVGNPTSALLVRHLFDASHRDLELPLLIDLAHNTTRSFTVVNDNTFNGPTGFQFIQTLSGEPLPQSGGTAQLDAVMLADLPLKDTAGNPYPNPPSFLGNTPRRALLRNSTFTTFPDGPANQFSHWFIQIDQLPGGCQRFCVSGGHTTPVFYFHIINFQGCASGLFRWSASQGWSNCLLDNVMDLGVPNTDAPNDNTTFGPVFVNPYDPNQLFVLTSSAIMVSNNSGSSFSRDDVLTALLTSNEKFRLIGRFGGMNEHNLPLLHRASPMATLSHMAFNRDRPHEVIAASPYTGLFYSRGDGTWLDLTASLTQPLSPISSVGFDYTGIYVVMEGRSILRATTFHSLRLFLESKGVKSVRPLQPTGTISVRSLMGR